MKQLEKIEALYKAYQEGKLGGEVMPEDANPSLEISSCENFLYFTLPMALNYQRNSYTLWESAKKTYCDPTTRFVFDPYAVTKASFEQVQQALVKYKVALQKEKQTQIWITLCHTFVNMFQGDIRKLFSIKQHDVNLIRDFIQKEHKKDFPYLSGTKICNYWLYVIYQYTNEKYQNIECLTVAPDTHVIKSSYKLDVITQEELNSTHVQEIVINRWNAILKNSKLYPIDIHTPLWLWSRNGFPAIF